MSNSFSFNSLENVINLHEKSQNQSQRSATTLETTKSSGVLRHIGLDLEIKSKQVLNIIKK